MKDLKFDARDLQILELAARKSGRCLEGAQATWRTLLGHLTSVNLRILDCMVHSYGGLRGHGKLSGVDGIFSISSLGDSVVHVTVFHKDNDEFTSVMFRGRLTPEGFTMENGVLDYVLGREG